MKTLLALLLLAAPASIAFAEPKIDVERLGFHIKETFNIPAGVEMKLGKPEKSEIAGLWKVTMTLTRGGQAQERAILVGEDGKKYLVAEIQDATKLPDADNVAKLKLAGAAAKGPAAAKVTVVEFTDYQCPYCKRAHESIEENLFKTYGDKVRLVFKHFPLTGMHPWAEPASQLSACVQKINPGAFWQVTNGIFGMQQDLTLENVKSKVLNLSAASGADRKKVEACFDKKETESQVKKDMAEGDAVGVNSTPTLFVNGHKLTGYGSFDQLKALIDEMLAGTHSPASLKN